MKPSEIYESATTVQGFRARALFEREALTVQVDEQEVMISTDGKEPHKTWWIRSRVVVVLPSTVARARLVVESHVALFDPQLIELLAPVWELWGELPVRGAPVSAPASPTIN